MLLTNEGIQSNLHDILSANVHEAVSGYEPLTTVFHLDRLDALSRAVDETEDMDVHQAMGASMMAHRHPAFCQQLADAGFFEAGLNQLLDLAADDDLLSARLVPVFAEAEEQAHALNLSDELVERLIEEMNRARSVWGFAVVDADEGGYQIVLDEDTAICA